MMKKIILGVAIAFAILGTSCGHGGGSLKTDTDSLAYAFGIDFGTALRNFDSTININTVMAGVKDAFNQKNKMTTEEAFEYRREYFMVKLPLKEKKASEEFLADIEKNNKNVRKTDSGLLYEIIEPGSDLRPEANTDTVLVVYEGALKNGQVFDSSRDRGDTVRFTLNRMIAGWTEGLKLIGKGGKVKLWIPSDLAYGANGNPNIGPNQALAFDIELIDVKPTVIPEEPVEN